MSTDQVYATYLDNGLRVLIKEVHTAPVASSWIWYRVGGRNEKPGNTGISHWVEHMLFKGTPNFGKGQIMRLINKNGGVLNGMTAQDFTIYFETLPADRIDLALRIEADRMSNALFEPDEVEAERTVIISEREGAENSPFFLLAEEVAAAAFKVHPYGQQVIGWKCDLQAITRDELWAHYRTYYVPNNAVLVVVGDVDTAAILRRIEELFGSIPPGDDIPPVRAEEPPQYGERRVRVERPGTTAYFLAVYHVPAARHPDFFPLVVLDAVLSGAKPMSISAPSASNRTSRLYRALVDTQLAVAATSSFGPTLDPGLFSFVATVRAGHSLEEVEEALFAEVERVAREPVAEEELARVLKQTRAQFAYSAEGVTNQAFWLGRMELIGSYTLLDTFLDNLSRVTAEDVQRVAAEYLTPRNRTVGWFVPLEV